MNRLFPSGSASRCGVGHRSGPTQWTAFQGERLTQSSIETAAPRQAVGTARDRMARVAAHSGHTDPSCPGCLVLAANGSRTMQTPPAVEPSTA